MALERALARGVLRAVKEIDRKPEALALVFCPPHRLYDRENRRALALQYQSIVDRTLVQLGSEFLFGEASLARAVRRNLIRGDADAGFAALRKANRILELAAKAAEKAPAPRSFPELDFILQRSTEAVAPGDFLVAHPFACAASQIFHQSVVLICERRPDGSKTGLVVNRATTDRVFHGGPCIGDYLTLAAAPETPKKARRVAGDLFLCKDDLDVHSHAKLFFGFASWDPLQLEIELERQVWLRCRVKSGAAADLALAGSSRTFASTADANAFNRAVWAAAVTSALPSPAGAALASLAMDHDDAQEIVDDHFTEHHAMINLAFGTSHSS